MTWDVLLVLLNPHETLRLAGQEHGRAIPLGDICSAAKLLLLDHLIGGDEQFVRHGETEHESRLRVDD
jgi:hypothetical protein